MSGLFGIVRFDGQAVAEADLQRQASALSHLGPDGRDLWRQGPVAMGALRMNLVREDAFDRQPLVDDRRGLTLVADARLDNREELAAALSIDGAELERMADSTLLFRAYQAWGADCAQRLLGDFAFAAWDDEAGALTLGRDHMGQRQIFFHVAPGFFAFATERKGLWALPEVPRRLPRDLFVRRLTNGVRAEPRAFNPAGPDGIGLVPGGSVVTVDIHGAIAARRYWEPRAAPEHEGRDEAYYVEAYRRVLSDAVACRVGRTIAPAGLFLSGGFDSAAVAALAGPTLAKPGHKLVAAASVMPEDYRGDIRHARKWVELCRRDMPHLDVRYVTREGLDVFTDLEKGFQARDWAASPNGYVSDALLRSLAGAGVRVAMDGHGGDYTLNARPAGHLLYLLRSGRLRRFASEWGARRRFLGLSQWGLVKMELLHPAFPVPSLRWRRLRNGLRPLGPTGPAAKGLKRAGPEAIEALPRRSARDTMRRILEMQQDMVVWTVAASAHGIKFTQPYHDKRVVELALAIPPDLYMRGGRERHLARTALKDLYPPEFQQRRPVNDDWTPDFLAMVKRVEPKILAEIDRMERAGKLSEFFDFPRMRRMLTKRSLHRHLSGHEYDTGQAVSAFLLGRYIEWFRGDNA
jgi:asparagine synthase (glutamine-hydrolysing)